MGFDLLSVYLGITSINNKKDLWLWPLVGNIKVVILIARRHEDALFWRFCLIFMAVDIMVNTRFLASITDFVCCGLLGEVGIFWMK